MSDAYCNGIGGVLSASIPCIDETPHAPLADAIEIDELSFDIIPLRNGFIQKISPALNAPEEPNDSGSDEGMEGDNGTDEEENEDFDLNEDGISDDDEGNHDEDEYPELSRNDGDAAVEGDSYDFAVMDTEKDTNEGARKRKSVSSRVAFNKHILKHQSCKDAIVLAPGVENRFCSPVSSPQLLCKNGRGTRAGLCVYILLMTASKFYK
ncbi:unnamed protein product [Anisakis simplex]|uniref:Prostatic spermine-binding protein-like n=1 Tax=Anisakis simplex TaxID=6269 RepID=A0A0M3JZ74_ANISI|nr:unnamed protein product [Anisakis simplex]